LLRIFNGFNKQERKTKYHQVSSDYIHNLKYHFSRPSQWSVLQSV